MSGPERRTPAGVRGLDSDLLAGGASPVPAEVEPGGPAVLDLGALAGRLRRWTGLLGAFFTAQAASQAASLAAGLLLVRFLPVGEFAFYTLASSVLVTLTFATDLGSSSALLHFFHRARTAGEPFAPYAAAVASLRRRLFAAAAPVALAALVAWGRPRGIPPSVQAAVAALVLVAAWLQIGGAISLLLLRLEERFVASYRAEIGGAITRLALASLVIVAGWRFAAPALATAAAAIAVTALLARAGAPPAGLGAAELAPARRAVLRYLAPTLPGAVYFAVQGQFVVWLAATFGGTTNLAQVGALGRLGLVVGLFSSLASVVFLPQLVRITDEAVFRRRTLQFGAFLAALGGLLLAAAWLAPRAFLFLLGPSYRGLDFELLLVVATAALTLVGGYLVAVNNARSWTRWQVAAVAVLALAQVALAATLPLGTTAGVLWFGLGSTAVGLAAQLVIAALGFTRPRWVSW